MKSSEKKNVFVATYNLKITDDNKDMIEWFDKQFETMSNYKNGYVKYLNSKLDILEENNEEYRTAINRLRYLNSTEGKSVSSDDDSDEKKELKRKIAKLIKDNYVFTIKTDGEYKKKMYLEDPNSSVLLYDDSRIIALNNVRDGFVKVFYRGMGKNVSIKECKTLNAISSKAQYSWGTYEQTGELVYGGSIFQIIYDEEKNKYYLKTRDFRNGLYDSYLEKVKSGKAPRYTYCLIPIIVHKNDLLQKAILKNGYIGQIKLSRNRKKGKYRYQVQISFKGISPKVEQLDIKKSGKVAINIQTETFAYCCDDGTCRLEMLTYPNIKDDVDKLKEYSRQMTKLRQNANPEMYKEDGQFKYTKKEMKQLGLKWRNTKGYIRAVINYQDTCSNITKHRINYQNSILNSDIIPKGNQFIVDNNNYKAWMMHMNRMSKKSKNKYANKGRVKNYSKQVHYGGPATFNSRIQYICDCLGYEYDVVSRFDTSKYNHFTDTFDLFENLNERMVVMENEGIPEEYNPALFSNTFLTIMDKDGNKYIVQRDLYAASKMLFLYKVAIPNEKTGDIYYIHELDKDGYAKFFKEKFYPNQINELKRLINLYNCGNNISGTVFGNK